MFYFLKFASSRGKFSYLNVNIIVFNNKNAVFFDPNRNHYMEFQQATTTRHVAIICVE